MAGVTRSCYYRWCQVGDADAIKEQRDRESFQLILLAYQFRGYSKGVWGIHMRLLHMGIRMNHKKIRRLMRKYGLWCPIRQANPTRQLMREMRTNAVADNLLKREFKEHGARAVLLTDITYIPLQQEFCYLSVILDACTMEVLSYVLSDSLKVDFVLLTVNQLLKNHGSELQTDVLLHSDQGSHYTSISFRQLLSSSDLRQSMSRKGNCWDNAPQESFFGHMKDELQVRARQWNSLQGASVAIDDWMDYYNNDRCQLGLNKLTPREYYTYITEGTYPESMLH
ncbi:MAG: IS3 family transposase [Lachnospiraceae bacterium]|jgi:transposase InsO family protein|nr:IS3 family transposase [Lachnospiraceae bacterium]